MPSDPLPPDDSSPDLVSPDLLDPVGARGVRSDSFDANSFEADSLDADTHSDVWLNTPPPPRSTTDWSALATHIGELAAAGLPLPQSLRMAASHAKSQRRAITLRHMANRLDDGVDLPTVVRDSGLPSVATLAAALEAGHASQDLYSVLQPVVYAERVRQQLRSRLRASLAYPYLVVTVGFLLAIVIFPRCMAMFEMYAKDAGYDPTTPAPVVSAVLVGIPAVVLALATIEVIISFLTGRVPFAWWRPVRETQNQLTYYVFVSHLAILVENDVPLPDALNISGGVAGGKPAQQAESLAEAIQAGQSFESLSHHFKTAPQVVRTLLGSLAGPSDARGEARRSSRLLRRLKDAAEMLFESIEARLDRFERIRLFYVVVILGFGVMGYALMLFWPLVHAYSQTSLDPALLG